MVEIAVKALSLVAVVGLALVLKRVGWASIRDFPLVSRLVLSVTLPCALLTSFNEYTLDTALLSLVLIGLVATSAQQVIGYLLARCRGRREQAFAVLNSGSFNIGAFGMPYLSGFMGPQAILYAALFDIGNAVGGAGIGYGWGMALSREPGRRRWRETLRTLLGSPVLITYLALLAMQLLRLRLPDPVIAFTGLVGAANPFLAMLMIGLGLEIRLDRSKYAAAARHLAVRYAFCAVAAWACWTLLPFGTEVRLVLVMVLFAPIASMIAGFTGRAGLDVELSSFMTSVSLIVGIVAMPTLYVLLTS